ncbi:release factor glutamine methyltransferase [Allocatelliglobosispora scoriae]|uniref:Release factor glutamine methyltransferase n=1 Tax=Allocatelliglobosispora scoriae TaxID=643052 RepID=A0A841BYW5_9ACTN|nr:release factor glutamine methyltransferase [Allocatelliglobosispora scoriae]
MLGWAAFCGHRVGVDLGVFVPRVRTELLARTAAEGLRDGAIVVDLCCGAGAIALVLAQAADGVEVWAADVDPAAVACATRNLAAFGGRVSRGDLFDALPDHLRGRIDVLAANVPYVPTGAIETLPAEARLHEARVALDGGDDGLDLLRRVAAEAGAWLAPGGTVLMEVTEEQEPTATKALLAGGLTTRVVLDDELGATVVIGVRA